MTGVRHCAECGQRREVAGSSRHEERDPHMLWARAKPMLLRGEIHEPSISAGLLPTPRQGEALWLRPVRVGHRPDSQQRRADSASGDETHIHRMQRLRSRVPARMPSQSMRASGARQQSSEGGRQEASRAVNAGEANASLPLVRPILPACLSWGPRRMNHPTSFTSSVSS